MRRTLLTLAALAAVTLPLAGCGDEPAPTPEAHTPLAVLTAEPTPEPLPRGGAIAPLAPTRSTPATVTAASPTSTTPTPSSAPALEAGEPVVETPAPAAVIPQPAPVDEAPVVEPEPVLAQPAPELVEQREPGEQLPGERIGRQLDIDGEVCTVVAVEPDVLECEVPA